MMSMMSLRHPTGTPDLQAARRETDEALARTSELLSKARGVSRRLDEINSTNGFVQMFRRLLSPAA